MLTHYWRRPDDPFAQFVEKRIRLLRDEAAQLEAEALGIERMVAAYHLRHWTESADACVMHHDLGEHV